MTPEEDREFLSEKIPAEDIEYWFGLLQEAREYFKDEEKRYIYGSGDLDKEEKYGLLKKEFPQLFEVNV